MTNRQPKEIQDVQMERAALGRLAERDRELRADHAEAMLKRDEIQSAWEPADEVVSNMRRLVDSVSTDQATMCSSSIVRAFSGTLEQQRDGSYEDRPARLWDVPQPNLRFVHLCLLFPDQIKARLEEIIRSQKFVEGVPISKRRRVLADAEAVIRSIEDRHTELVDAAASLEPPIQMHLLPEVQARRATEAAAMRRAADGEAHRKQQEDYVNEMTPHRRGLSESSYLERSRQKDIFQQ